MQIGKYNVSYYMNDKRTYIHDFGIFIEVAPDEEQKQQLENIQMALQRDQITFEDAIDIREVKNVKWLTNY